MRAWLYLLAVAIAGAIVTTPAIFVFVLLGGSFNDALVASLGTLMLASAIAVVSMRDIIRCGLAMIVCFLALAGLYVSLGAVMVAAPHVIVYLGAISVAVLVSVAAAGTQWGASNQAARVPTNDLANLLFGNYVLAFEAVSVLLLAAVIGGGFLAKRAKDAG